MMTNSQWTELFCREVDWPSKQKQIVEKLNENFGDGFASARNDNIRVQKGPRWIEIGMDTHTKYRVGQKLHIPGKTGTPINGEKMIYHLGNFAAGKAI